MQLENQPDQIQPQSAPARLTVAGLLHAVKRREELRQSFRTGRNGSSIWTRPQPIGFDHANRLQKELYEHIVKATTHSSH